MELLNAPKSKSNARRVLLAGAVVCGLLLAGCGTSSTQPSGVKLAAAEGGVAVGSVGTGPFSSFKAGQLERIKDAQQATRLKCVADNGYPEIATIIPAGGNAEMRGQLDVGTDDIFFASAQDAATKGFGQPTPASPAKVLAHHGAFEAISDTCDKQAWQALGGDAQTTVAEYQQILARLVSGPMNAVTKAMPDMTAKLAKCLAERGNPVTTGGGSWGMDFGIKLGGLERPREERTMPTGTKGLEIIPGTPTNPYIPTAEESRLASALYECSVSTGVRTDLDQVIHTAQDKTEAANAVAIEGLNPKIQILAEKAESQAGA
jgi:hypothetical protein